MTAATGSPPPAPSSPDPAEILKSRAYLALLVIGAVVGVFVATVAYYFLYLVGKAQEGLFTDLPKDLGFHGEPLWWPLPWVVASGVVVALTIRYLPGTSGHEPSDGFKAGGQVAPIDLFGIILAAFATLAGGLVLGPEAPLIAIGNGLGVWAVHLIRRGQSPQAVLVIGAAGSFAALATLLGNPIIGAFLLMEAIGLGGQLMEVILLPGLLAAGVGALIFVGFDDLTGFGTFSLAITRVPHAGPPTGAEFLWAVVIGVVCGVGAVGIFKGARLLKGVVEGRRLALTPVVGLAVGGLAVAFQAATGHSSSEVLFSGQNQLPGFIHHAATWTVGALVLVVVCKGLGYGLSLSSFRGGPVFPSLFLGAAVGIVFSHLPGLGMIDGAAIGMGAAMAAAVRLPLSSVLLTLVFFASDAAALTPVVIVGVVASYITAVQLTPSSASTAAAPGSQPPQTPGRRP